MTVSNLARAAGLSRTAVLYYESIGLLRPAKRTAANYRIYGEAELGRLRQIRSYRSAGLTLDDIRTILNQPSSDFGAILRRRLLEIDAEILRLREHQRAIARLLQRSGKLRRKTVITKEKWVEIMRASGFSEEDMHRWHAEFEKSAPAEHEEFLKFLRIPDAEVQSIRSWSRQRAEQREAGKS
jgi:MerR family transcriptional regulator, thiopeptide resistance regulator